MPRTEATVEAAKIEELCHTLTEGKKVVAKQSDGAAATLSTARLQELAAKIREQKSCPVVEDIEGDPKNKRVTFFYDDKGEKCEAVNVCSRSFASPLIDRKEVSTSLGQKKLRVMTELPKLPMQRIENTSVWVLTLELPTDAVFSYCISTKPGVYTADSLNRQALGFPPQASVFDLSPTPEINPRRIAEVKAGIERDLRLARYSISDQGDLTLRDDEYKPQENERMLTVHFPQGYDQTKTYPMRLFLDGGWHRRAEIPEILDDAGAINIMLEPKAIAANASSNRDQQENADRDQEYLPDKGLAVFAKLLSHTFIPKLQEKFHGSTAACDTTIWGSSLSGYAAMYIGLHYPEVFGNVITQSAALWLDQNNLLTLLQSNPAQFRNSRVYSEVSYLDHPKIFKFNHIFDETMKKVGLGDEFHRLVENYGEHHPAAWQKFFVRCVHALDALRATATSEMRETNASCVAIERALLPKDLSAAATASPAIPTAPANTEKPVPKGATRVADIGKPVC